MDKHYRHGDILLIKINKLPENMKFKTKKSKVILKGEVTGHAHRLEGNAKILEAAKEIANRTGRLKNSHMQIEKSIDESGQVSISARGPFISDQRTQIIGYAVVKEPTELVHEEHNTITLPIGTYEVRRQREYDADYIRFVED
ncbi:MAG: hypothetical protein KAW56_07900 [Candidatus Marinimicrobia bacterium]|nr:hypothetical protein [Candidatus Neomarinimicrobiota bacterium]